MIHLLKNKIYIRLIIIGLIILSLVLFFIVPLVTKINDDSANLLSEKDEVAILKAQSDEIENFKRIYNEYKPNLDNMSQLFIDPQNPVDFIKFIENTAAASSIKVQTSLIANPKDQTMVSFQLFSSDDFSKILHFLQALESGPYLVDAQTISIKNTDTPDAKDYPSGKVDVNFSLNVFAKQ